MADDVLSQAELEALLNSLDMDFRGCFGGQRAFAVATQ